MAAIAIVSSGLFIGLAVLGWGGFGAFLVHLPFIAVLVVFVLLLDAAMFTQGNLNLCERGDRAIGGSSDRSWESMSLLNARSGSYNVPSGPPTCEVT